MLEALLRGQGRTVAWQTLEDQLCGSEGGISLNALEVSMHRLRRRLVAMGCTAVIQNVRGVGYSMKAPA